MSKNKSSEEVFEIRRSNRNKRDNKSIDGNKSDVKTKKTFKKSFEDKNNGFCGKSGQKLTQIKDKDMKLDSNERQTTVSTDFRVDHKIDESIAESLPFPELTEDRSDPNLRIKCGKCCFATDSEAEMILHSVNHNFVNQMKTSTKTGFKSKLKCPTCGQSFTKPLLEKHVYIHTSEEYLKCEECHKCFTNYQNLVKHKNKHKLSESLIHCEICSTTFTSKKNYQKHQMIHREDRQKSHLCDVCGQGFYDKESLKSHTFRIHLPKTARKFKCQFEGCRYSCLYQHQMLEHQKVHSDDKPWVCDQCEYTAKSKWTFKKHYRKHTQEKPFKCPHCAYASSLSSNLTRHLRIHTGSKPFKCPYCSYSCNNHENLRKHVLNTRKHKGLYLYNCMHCVFGTNVFSDLRRHIEQTHKDIYTVEQIDRMISSIYHKHEDNTTVVPTPDPYEEHPMVDKTSQNSNSLQQTDNSCEMVLPNDIEDQELNNKPEVMLIDSNVLEAQEVCVNQIIVFKALPK